ncbi:MAG TPA: nitroreductase family deazaflavin-dependent oxidoreductase [Solirubrobacteraceae bacterium]|jgi:deazaflavin-dependent oxidoreductase (nitroreductase family)|nr:nitroreductase family deazaflavin-dependent oxidoreductase [Solirubrobacteraceae bacterium]
MSLFDSTFRTTLRVHQFLYERTDGRIGHRLLGVSTLLLRTTGRRSAQLRTNALNYVEDSGRYIVVASRGGAPNPPAWLLNLQANPHAEVQIARRRIACTASVINHNDPEFARLWELVNERNAGRYDAYQKKTERQIPLVALTPDR